MIPVIITLGNPDPDVAPATFPDAINEIRPLLSGEIQETISTFVMGTEVPPVDDQDKPWFRITTLGAPVGWYKFHLGVWVREQPSVGSQIGYFTGDPTLYFDSNGRGLKGAGPVAGDYWGWHLMNGIDNTANLSDKFIIAGRMDNEDITGFGGGQWRTNVNGTPESEGGQAEVFLDADNTYSAGSDVLTVGTWNATSGQAQASGGALYGIVGPGTFTTDLIAAEDGNTEPLSINIVNPFFCMAIIQFLGYKNDEDF